MTEYRSPGERIEWAGYTFVIKTDKEIAYLNDKDETSVEGVIDGELDEFYGEGQFLNPDFAEAYNESLAAVLPEAIERYQLPLKELGEFAAKYALIPGQLSIFDER